MCNFKHSEGAENWHKLSQMMHHLAEYSDAHYII